MAGTINDWLLGKTSVRPYGQEGPAPKPSSKSTPKYSPLKPIPQSQRNEVKSSFADWVGTVAKVTGQSGPSKTFAPVKPITDDQRDQVRSGYAELFDWLMDSEEPSKPSKKATPKDSALKPITDGQRDAVQSGYSDWILGTAAKQADKPSEKATPKFSSLKPITDDQRDQVRAGYAEKLDWLLGSEDPSKESTAKFSTLKPITDAQRDAVKSEYSDWILSRAAKAADKPEPRREEQSLFDSLKNFLGIGDDDKVTPLGAVGPTKAGHMEAATEARRGPADKPEPRREELSLFDRLKNSLGIGDDDEVTPIGAVGPTKAGHMEAATDARRGPAGTTSKPEPRREGSGPLDSLKNFLGIGDDDKVTPLGAIGPTKAGHMEASTDARRGAEAVSQKRRDAAAAEAEGPGIAGRENPYGTEEMSWEDFKKLGRRQKAVVDLNTLQADASAADMELGTALADVPEEDRERYTKMADELGFDGNRGSERYAPNTLALIKQLDLNTGTRDLDEFIDLSVAATRDELKNLRGGPRGAEYYEKRYAKDPSLTKEQLLREDEQRRWAEESGEKIKEAMTKSLEKGNEVLADFRSTMEADRSKIVRDLGATPREIKVPTGYGPGVEGSDDRDFQNAYMALQDASAVDQRPAFFEELNRWDEKKLNSFFDYADQRSRNERKFGMPELPGHLAGTERIAIPEFRDMLGLS